MTTADPGGCRACRHASVTPVLDLGHLPSTTSFPPTTTPPAQDASDETLVMGLCRRCGLAQLAGDDVAVTESVGLEPQVLRDQAALAVDMMAKAGYLDADTVAEFGSPHGGTWIPLLNQRGLREVSIGHPADVVVDSFGLMHEPDQAAAIQRRLASLTEDGVLLLQYHSLATIVANGQWTTLRHGHYAYYSLTALTRLLAGAGLHVVDAAWFDLYGGTVLLVASRAERPAGAAVGRILDEEARVGIDDPAYVRTLQRAEMDQVEVLRDWLERAVHGGRKVHAYGAASRAVPLLSRARVTQRQIASVADASPTKQGRRMPGTDIPIVSPEELLREDPDDVLLMMPDALDEVRRSYPGLDGRWVDIDTLEKA